MSDARVPRLVTFGWAGVTSEPTIDVRFDWPATFREVKVPTLVILSWAGSDTCLATFT